MTPKEKAHQLFKESFDRWCYENSHEKNVATAKSAAEYVCDQIIESRKDDKSFDDSLFSVTSKYHSFHPMYLSYWKQVKEEIRAMKF